MPNSVHRTIAGFIAGALAVAIFHQGMYLLMKQFGVPLPGAPWNMAPAASAYGMPTVLNQMFWGGLWGILFTGAIGASFWPYYARMHAAWPIPDSGVTVPMGYAAFPREILRPPRSVAEKVYTDIRRWTAMPKGGHFAAMEQPEALAREIIEFFRSLRPR